MTTTTKNQPKGRVVKCERDLRYDFTDKEILEFARDCASKQGELQETEDRLKEIKSDFKARTDMLVGHISLLSRKVANGYEFRSIPCEVRYHDPKPGEKTTYRLDTDTPEIVRVEEMTFAEKQEELPLEEEESSDAVPFESGKAED